MVDGSWLMVDSLIGKPIRIFPQSTLNPQPSPNSEKSRARRYGQDLSPLVVTTSGTNPVRHIGRRALRARAELRQFEDAVVRAGHANSAFRRFTLGDTHKC